MSSPGIAPPASRNAPCPCGSGQRYKACHGAVGAPGHDRSSNLASLQHALALHNAGRLEDAEAAYREALVHDPASFDALHMLGLIRHQRGAADEAIALIERALQRFAGHAAAYSNLGLALLAAGRAVDAVARFDQALALAPAFVEAHANRGMALVQLGQHEDAVAAFECALAIDPAHAAVLSNLGNAWLEMRRLPEAVQTFERLVALAPHYDGALGALLATRLACCDWDGFAAQRDGVLSAVAAGRRVVTPFSLLAIADAPDAHLACARAHVADLASLPMLPARAPRGDRRIRIGYLSSDFREHAVAYLVAGLLEAHDRGRFEVVAFSHGPAMASPIRERIVRACDAFHDVRSLGDAQCAEQIRERSIDILVDLNGLTLGARLPVLARRAAPLQVNWLGYPGTMALPAIDYLIADACVVPTGDERWYTERVVRLPGSYQVNDPRRPLPAAPPARRDEGLPERGFVFCCFNNNYKILPATFDLWMRLLRAVDGSVLWLLEDNAHAARNLRAACRDRGVDPVRLVFAQRTTLAAHLARHRLADVFLDTLPYNAHTTASDALWCGVPVVTCPGRSFASRVAKGLVNAAGVPELAARDRADYEAMALDLARSPARLNGIRERLIAQRASAPLFDTDRFRRAIERAYTAMWTRHLRGEPPAAFDVAAEGA